MSKIDDDYDDDDLDDHDHDHLAHFSITQQNTLALKRSVEKSRFHKTFVIQY